MVFWILIALLTGAAALSVLIPLSRTMRAEGGVAARADEAVYREQLSAIDSELERGLIDPEAAEAARTEVARRLLAAHEKKSIEPVGKGLGSRIRLVQIFAVLALPVAAFGLYLAVGRPDMPDQPLVARLGQPEDQQSVDVLVARVERHLANNPEDGQGWAVVAPVYMSMGQPQASARAYANAIRILGPRQEWLTDMGEAMTVANQGMVTADARRAFEEAVSLDANAVKPRFFLAIALGQEGRKEDAVNAWQELLEGADETAAWVGAARQELARVQGVAPPALPLRGPSQQDVAASQEMSADDRQSMIEGMVAGLADRLETQGGSAQEWNQLIRAYMVLGERGKAENALASAQAAFESAPEDLSRINETASQLGLTGS